MRIFIAHAMMAKLFSLLCWLALVLMPTSKTCAQSIGVALGGGGAKGMAHIGFLQAFEDNHIPIDYIGGTSIGAIVGGLYASGYTPAQMVELLSSDKFASLLKGDVLEEYKYFSLREHTSAILSLGVEKTKDGKLKFVLPTNFIPESPINLLLNEVFASAGAFARGNFDNLFVPFRCVATNIYADNKTTVFKNGYLGYAIRASMAFPIVFKAVKINDSLYFDGGIMNNLPADIMIKEFSPDYTIAHKVTSMTHAVRDGDLYHQLETVLMRGDNLSIPADKGVILHSDMSAYSLLDFNNIDSAYLMGYATAKAYIDSVLPLGLLRQEDQIGHEMDRGLFNSLKPKLVFDNLSIKGVDNPLEINYMYKMVKSEQGVLNMEGFAKGYYRLLAEPMVKELKPVFKYNQRSGYFDVDLNVVKDQAFKFNLGGHLSTLPANQIYLSADYNLFSGNNPYYFKAAIDLGQFYNSASLTSHIEFASKRKFYLKPQIKYHSLIYKNILLTDFLSNSSGKFDTQKRQIYGGVKMELPVSRKSTIMLEPNFTITYADQFVGTAANEIIPEKNQYMLFSARAIYKHSSKERLQYAKNGSETVIVAEVGHGVEDFSPGSTSVLVSEFSQVHNMGSIYLMKDIYITLSKKNTLGIFLEGMGTVNQAFATLNTSTMFSHAFSPTPTSQIMYDDHLRSNNYGAFGLRYIYSFNDNFDIRAEGYAFAPFVKVNEGYYKATEPPYSIEDAGSYVSAKNEIVNPMNNINYLFSSAIVYNTSLGPISLSVDYSPDGNNDVFIGLNFGFLIFDNWGL
ncbi:MAG: patatin-like phospholipase family protein [Bacteroidales bacterium]